MWPEISKLLAREDDVDVTPDGMVEMMGQLDQLVQSRGTWGGPGRIGRSVLIAHNHDG